MSDIRQLPAVTERVETGAIQFGDDWPGVFIRGDMAFGYAMALEAVLNPSEHRDVFAEATVRGLRMVLSAGDLTGLSRPSSGGSVVQMEGPCQFCHAHVVLRTDNPDTHIFHLGSTEPASEGREP